MLKTTCHNAIGRPTGFCHGGTGRRTEAEGRGLGCDRAMMTCPPGVSITERYTHRVVVYSNFASRLSSLIDEYSY